jgi:hypothetical protein
LLLWPGRRLRRTGLAAAVGLASWLLASGAWAETADPLVDLLVKKGVLTTEEASRLPRGAASRERDALAKLLEAKGVLTADEVARLEAAAPPIEQVEASPPPGELPVYTHADKPLTLTLGSVDLTLSGFIDYEALYRTHNAQAIGTIFGTIPYSNTPQGRTSEFRTTAQDSRLALKGETGTAIGGERTDVAAYTEVDFSGNDAPNVNVTSNSDTFRLRQAFLDVRRGAWEVLVGQAWSWQTPNSKGLGSYPGEVFLTDNYDPNFNVGLNWARQPVLRFIYHPDSEWAMGLSIENPDQFGGLNEITFPAGFAAELAHEVGNGAAGITVPDAAPDLVPKASFDGAVAGHDVHLEAAGLVSFFRIAGLDFGRHTAVGYGGELGGNVALTPGLTAIAYGFGSRGGGRYIFALAPDIVVLPTPSGSDVFISSVTSYSGLAGLEWQATTRLKVSGYWGFMRAERNYALDTTAGAEPGSFVGFGYPGSPNNQNRWANEAAFDIGYIAWNHPRWGALQVGMQYSYIEREPWFVAAGAPASASLHQFWWDVRYILP